MLSCRSVLLPTLLIVNEVCVWFSQWFQSIDLHFCLTFRRRSFLTSLVLLSYLLNPMEVVTYTSRLFLVYLNTADGSGASSRPSSSIAAGNS